MSLKKRLVITIILMVLIPAALLLLIAGVMYSVFLLGGGAAPPPETIVLDDEFFAQALDPGSRIFRLAVIFAVCAIVILAASFVAGVTYISRKILPPMEELARAARRISAGELEFEILGSNVSEISDLCGAFDEMRKRLRDNIAAELELERERNLMLAHISHDLRTPITSIQGYAEGLLDGVASTEEMRRRYLETIVAKSGSMQRMIEQLSDFSELELGRMAFDFRSLDIVEFLRAIGDDYRTDIESADASFSLALPDEPVTVRLDPEKLGRVFSNILTNAIKYRSPERRLEIALSAERTPTGIHITVADNGKGVPPEDLERVFEGFYRADPARTGGTSGHGLGLAISRRIVLRHNGHIWMTARDGGGSEIHITLPKEGEDEDPDC